MIIISIHCFPHELKNYERIIIDLNKCTSSIPSHNFRIESCLNINNDLIDWKHNQEVETKDSSQYFIDTSLKSKINCKYKIVNQKNFLGCNEHRRSTINDSNEDDAITFLDCDIHFDEKILDGIYKSTIKIKKFIDHYIITPTTVRLWDETWDCIVNDKYKNHKIGFQNNVDFAHIPKRTGDHTKLKPVNEFKWAGGWFNTISSKLLKKINIPKSFVGYGPDDTFVMAASRIMRRKGYKIQQYKLENLIVCEDRNPQKYKYDLKNDIPNFRENSEMLFTEELKKISKNL